MFSQDFRYGLRGLWLSKGFATVAISVLGFGIGLNTTIFSIVDGVLLKPFPYADPDRIVVLLGTNQKAGIDPERHRPIPTSRTARERGSFFDDRGRRNPADRSRSPTAAASRRATPAPPSRGTCFRSSACRRSLGRGFTAADDKPGAEGTVLLSYAVWTTRYQTDPTVDRPARADQRVAGGHRRRDAAEVRVPQQPEALDSARADRANDDTRSARQHGRSRDSSRASRRSGGAVGASGIAARWRSSIRTTNQDWGVHIAHAARAVHPAGRDDRHLADDGRRHARAAHRRIERRESAAGARVRAAARDSAARGARRRPPPHRPAARSRRASCCRWPVCRSAFCSPRAARGSSPPTCRPIRCRTYITLVRSTGARSTYSVGRRVRDGRRLRPGAGASGHARESARLAEGRDARQQRAAVAPAQRPRRGPGLARARRARRCAAVRPDVLEPRRLRCWIQPEAADDDAVLHARAAVRAARRAAPARARTSSSASKRCRGCRARSGRTSCR